MEHLIDLPKGEGRNSEFGWHFLEPFRTCPMLWYNTYLRPHPSGKGVGCVPEKTPKPLLLGLLIHRALEAWYLSGWQDGQYSLEAALEAANLELKKESARIPDDSSEAELFSELREVMFRHHRWCGPGGVMPEFPDWQVLADADGQPMIERTFKVPLGFGGFVFTARIDAIMAGPRGTRVWEHKSCAAQRQSSAIREYRISGQLTGQLWCLSEAWPAHQVDEVYVNLIVKGAAAEKPPRQLHAFGRSREDLEKFRLDTVRDLNRLNDLVGEYKDLVRCGTPHHLAALMVFTSHPSGKTCAGEYRPCDFYESCIEKKNATKLIQISTVPRIEWQELKGTAA